MKLGEKMYQDGLAGEIYVTSKDTWGSSNPVFQYIEKLNDVDLEGCTVTGIKINYTSNHFSGCSIVAVNSEGEELEIPFKPLNENFFIDFIKQAEIIIKIDK